MISADGQQVGILQSRDALNMAREAGLDLVVVSPQAQPPVCKIIDYGKYKYEQEKLAKESKKKQQDLKGIKFRPNTAEHDLGTLINHAKKFLEQGDKVRVVCQFKAREITHPEIGRNKMNYFAEKLAEYSLIEKTPALDGKLMIMILTPKPSAPGKQNAKDQDKQDSSEEI